MSTEYYIVCRDCPKSAPPFPEQGEHNSYEALIEMIKNRGLIEQLFDQGLKFISFEVKLRGYPIRAADFHMHKGHILEIHDEYGRKVWEPGPAEPKQKDYVLADLMRTVHLLCEFVLGNKNVDPYDGREMRGKLLDENVLIRAELTKRKT